MVYVDVLTRTTAKLHIFECKKNGENASSDVAVNFVIENDN